MPLNCEQRHKQAMMAPRSTEEKALTSMLHGVEGYISLLEQLQEQISAEAHAELTKSVGDIARAVRSLAKGPLGRLDAQKLLEQLEPIIEATTSTATVVQLANPQPGIGNADGHPRRNQPDSAQAVGQP